MFGARRPQECAGKRGSYTKKSSKKVSPTEPNSGQTRHLNTDGYHQIRAFSQKTKNKTCIGAKPRIFIQVPEQGQTIALTFPRNETLDAGPNWGHLSPPPQSKDLRAARRSTSRQQGKTLNQTETSGRRTRGREAERPRESHNKQRPESSRENA